MLTSAEKFYNWLTEIFTKVQISTLILEINSTHHELSSITLTILSSEPSSLIQWLLYCNVFSTDSGSSDDVPILLSVYEFDAKANLNHDDVECLLDKISKLPNVTANTFETIAGNIRDGFTAGSFCRDITKTETKKTFLMHKTLPCHPNSAHVSSSSCNSASK